MGFSVNRNLFVYKETLKGSFKSSDTALHFRAAEGPAVHTDSKHA